MQPPKIQIQIARQRHPASIAFAIFSVPKLLARNRRVEQISPPAPILITMHIHTPDL